MAATAVPPPLHISSPAIKSLRTSFSTTKFPVLPNLCSCSSARPLSRLVSAQPTRRQPSLSAGCSAVQDIPAIAEQSKETEEEEEEDKRRKLYVVNLPWNFSAPEIAKLFGECGTVKDVEIIKQKNGKSRGFAFITMASGQEAHAAVEKLDSFEISDRKIRVEFAKSFRKPATPWPTPTVETRHKIYVSNLAWKARSNNLRAFFAEKFNPVSARVVFDSSSGKAAGYGFVSFSTKEEAEAALTELDGKELMGRSIRLKMCQNANEAVESEELKLDNSDEHSQEN